MKQRLRYKKILFAGCGDSETGKHDIFLSNNF